METERSLAEIIKSRNSNFAQFHRADEKRRKNFRTLPYSLRYNIYFQEGYGIVFPEIFRYNVINYREYSLKNSEENSHEFIGKLVFSRKKFDNVWVCLRCFSTTGQNFASSGTTRSEFASRSLSLSNWFFSSYLGLMAVRSRSNIISQRGDRRS